MKRNALAKLATKLSIALLALGINFGAAQSSLAREGEEFAQAPQELAVSPATLDEGALADGIPDRDAIGYDAIVTEPLVIVTVVVPPAEPAVYEAALTDASLPENQPLAVAEVLETGTPSEAIASISEGAPREQATLEGDNTESVPSENETNALVWYPEVEVMILAAPVGEESAPATE